MPRGRTGGKSILSRYLVPIIATVVVVALAVVLIALHPWNRQAADTTVTPTAVPSAAPDPSADLPEETEAPDEPVETPEPTPEPSRLATPEPVDTSSAILPKQAEGYLPVFEAAATDKKQIAITVDDLWNADNVRQILSVANENGAHLTFFAIGEAVQNQAELLREIHEGGHEIENHTWSHVNLYGLTTKEMTAEVLKQNLLVSQALGVDYQMHFLRPRGGNALYDRRTHNLLSQLGYVGIAHWSVSGTPDMNTWASTLKAGDVILFHATDNDVKKLVKLIPALTEAGWEVVTLNTLYDLPDNAVYDLGTTTIGTTEGLDFEAIEDVPYGSLLKKGDASYAVQRLQRRLAELGFYSGEFDGDFGSGTETAVQAFQTAAGLTADGMAGEETQTVLFSDDAPVAAQAAPET